MPAIAYEPDHSLTEPKGYRMVLHALVRLAKRAGDTTGAVSPPPPPPNNDSNVPKIGGSFGGFIALVVVLASIVVISTVAVFFLLRSHKSSPYDRHARRVLGGKRETSIYEAPLGPPGMRSKFRSLFGRGQKNEGWVRAGSGDDEWDASDLNTSYGPVRELQDRDSRSPPNAMFAPQPRSYVSRSSTSDSIELEVPNQRSPPFDIQTANTPPVITNPFSSSPPPMQSPEDSDSDNDVEPREGRFSVQSGEHPGSIRSMRKFQGGTKFREQL
ncbi:hypothetical protein K474DRAFT_1703861 [Panus rudis PR-1116 ss-1]|nr:hypothetical protein K474DRAFT_1703861 [Panus rudis PR-1116 ss-1]